GFPKGGFELQLVGESQRAELYDSFWWLGGICDLVRDTLDGSRCRKTRHDNRYVACELSNAAGNRDICLRQFSICRRIDVESDHMPTSLDEIAGNRTAHDAEANDSNGLVHACLFPAFVFY